MKACSLQGLSSACKPRRIGLLRAYLHVNGLYGWCPRLLPCDFIERLVTIRNLHLTLDPAICKLTWFGSIVKFAGRLDSCLNPGTPTPMSLEQVLCMHAPLLLALQNMSWSTASSGSQIAFGILAIGISIVTIWQGQRFWKLWKEHYSQLAVSTGICCRKVIS